MEHPRNTLGEKWPWNPEFLRLALIVPGAIGLAVSVALFPTYGAHSLYFLLAIPVGLVLRLTFGLAGSRVNLLRDAAGALGGEAAEGLLVIGRVQSPGFAVLRESDLILLPIVGKSLSISLDSITRVHVGQWLPGKYVWGKTAFNLVTSAAPRVAFAVPQSIGAQWSPRLAAAANARDSGR